MNYGKTTKSRYLYLLVPLLLFVFIGSISVYGQDTITGDVTYSTDTTLTSSTRIIYLNTSGTQTLNVKAEDCAVSLNMKSTTNVHTVAITQANKTVSFSGDTINIKAENTGTGINYALHNNSASDVNFTAEHTTLESIGDQARAMWASGASSDYATVNFNGGKTVDLKVVGKGASSGVYAGAHSTTSFNNITEHILIDVKGSAATGISVYPTATGSSASVNFNDITGNINIKTVAGTGESSGIYTRPTGNGTVSVNFNNVKNVVISSESTSGRSFGIYAYTGTAGTSEVTVDSPYVDITATSETDSAQAVYAMKTSTGASKITFKNNGGSAIVNLTATGASMASSGTEEIFGARAYGGQIVFENLTTNIKAERTDGNYSTFGVRSYTTTGNITFDNANGNVNIDVISNATVDTAASIGAATFSGGNVVFNNLKTNISIQENGKGYGYGVLVNNGYINFNNESGVLDIQATAPDNAIGIATVATTAGLASTVDVKNLTTNIKAINLNADVDVNVEADAFGLYAANTVNSESSITFSNENSSLIISAKHTGDRFSYGAYAYGEHSAIILNNKYIDIYSEAQDMGRTYSLYTVNGADMRVNAEVDGSVLNADNIVKLEGHVRARYDGSTIDMNLTNANSYLRGLLVQGDGGAINALFANNAVWQPTGAGDMDNSAYLTLNNAVVDLVWWGNNNNDSSFRTISIDNANIIGTNTLIINTDIASGTADKFVIGNLTSEDDFIQNVKIAYDPIVDTLGLGNTNISLSNPITVVEVLDNVNNVEINTGRFSSNIQGALFRFEVTPELEVLGNTLVNIVGFNIESTDEYSDTGYTAIDNGLVIANLIRNSGADFIENRPFELRNGYYSNEVNNSKYGVWVKGTKSQLDMRSLSEGHIAQDSYATAVGYDFNFNNSTKYAGFYGSYADSKTDYVFAEGKAKELGLGIYGGWMGASGSYVDLAAKVGKISGNFEVDGDAKANFGVWHGAVSGEAGYRLKTADTISFETNARFTLGYVEGYEYEVDNGLAVNAHDLYTAVLRLNASLIQEFNGGVMFLGGSYYHDFSTPTELKLLANGVVAEEEISLNRDWGKASFGAEFDLSEVTFVHAEVSRLFGIGIGANWKANLGFTYKF